MPPVTRPHPPQIGQRTALARHHAAAARSNLGNGHQLRQMTVEHQAELLGLLGFRPLALELLAQGSGARS
jgi:hypothetical protein